MAVHTLEVDATHLHAGAERCVDAAGIAMAGAGNLEGKSPTAGMFGDFPAAHAFHGALATAHQAHVDRLHDHHRALTDIGDKSRSAAYEFTARDVAEADSVHAAETRFDSI
jgi:uncharacterized protein DUF2563